jgi:hypothetical protein
MATVKGPLFSLDASGAVGGAIVFSKWKGRNYLRRHAIPSNPKSTSQLSVRAMMQFLTQAWSLIGSGNQATWVAPAAITNVSPFNAFIGQNMKRWGREEYPGFIPSPPETATPGTLTTQTATAGVRSITIANTVSVLEDNWGILLYRSTTTGFTPSRNNMYHIIRATTATVFTFLDTFVTVGVPYYYRGRAITDDGVAGALWTEITATPTA